MVGDKVDAALRAIPAHTLERIVENEPNLRPYRYLVREADRDASHSVVPAQQTVLDATAKPALSSYWQLYQKIDRLPVGIEKSVRAQRVSEDRSVREAAWRRHWKIADAKADADASLLFGIVKQHRNRDGGS